MYVRESEKLRERESEERECLGKGLCMWEIDRQRKRERGEDMKGRERVGIDIGLINDEEQSRENKHLWERETETD